MATWDLAEIRTKVRQVTGRFSENELSTSKLDNYINQYYQYTFPAEVKLDRAHTFYEFLTIPNQPTYDTPSTFTNFEPEATVNQYSLLWYQDPDRFRQENWKQINRLTQWTGDGTTTLFTTTITGFPIWPGTTLVTDNTETFEDTNTVFANSPVTVAGDLGGSMTVNYETGVISVTFITAPTNGQDIFLFYALFAAKRPQSILYYNHQFEVYPIPDTAYRIQMKAYSVPDALTSASDRPPLDQWGPAIAYGASRDIHSDFGEYDAYGDVTALYKEQIAYVMSRTDNNLLNTRASPRF